MAHWCQRLLRPGQNQSFHNEGSLQIILGPAGLLVVLNPTYVTWKTGIFEVVANTTTTNFSVDSQTRILLANETGGHMISWASGVTVANGDRFRKDATTLLERACITDQPPTVDTILELQWTHPWRPIFSLLWCWPQQQCSQA